MKKLHFSLLAIFFALFAMVSFTACSSDDDDTPSTEDIQSRIIGMWQPTHVKGYVWDGDDEPAKFVDQDITLDDAEAFEFKQGGIFNEYYWKENKWNIDCINEQYTISGNKLTTYDANGSLLDVYTVVSINSTSMVLEYNMDGNSSYLSTITFKKIK